MPVAHRQNVRLGLLQHACGADIEANVAKALDMIRDAARQGAQIVATQELFTGVYFPQIEDERGFDLAEPIPGPTTDRLCELARELKIYITASMFEKRAPGLYHNTSVMIDDQGAILDKYRKMHIPDDPGFFEKYYFTPGDLGFRAQQTAHGQTGMLVCWDQWFPEAARLTAMHGAQVLFYPTAIGWIPEDPEDVRRQQRDAWQTVQRSHAIANGVYVAAINRIGQEDNLLFYGSSFVAAPSGKILAQASENEEEVLIVDCDLSIIDGQRKAWPFLRDRRIDAYQPLTARFLEP